MKTSERDMARKLRQEQGLSVPELARRLGVSKSSVSLWVRDVDLTPDQRSKLAYRKPVLAAWHRRRRLGWQTDGRLVAGRSDAFHAAGCMLFWAEGSRKRDSVQVSAQHLYGAIQEYGGFDRPQWLD